jgi:hypothetical protein
VKNGAFKAGPGSLGGVLPRSVIVKLEGSVISAPPAPSHQ